MAEVLLVSQEGESIRIPLKCANMMGLVERMLQETWGEQLPEIPLPTVNFVTLQRTVDYCRFYSISFIPERRPDDVGVPVFPFEEDFTSNLSQAELFELILAANYLDIRPLLDCCCRHVASLIKGKSPEELRDIFNIQNDFTPEEEEQIRRENEWVLEH